jgi:hypothetical protein
MAQAQAGISGVRWWLVVSHMDADYTGNYGISPLFRVDDSPALSLK